MRRVTRVALDAATQNKLTKKQDRVNEKRQAGNLNAQKEWDGARRTKPLGVVLAALQGMMGARERCMYCVDSHGCDIEHFWPKTPYPERMFQWGNLLLCCSECGRLKGNTFPLAAGQPLLVDPSMEDPWQHLDFDPATGNIVARFDAMMNDWSVKGVATVGLLHLDRREAMAAGYAKAFRRLSGIISRALLGGAPVAADLMTELLDADDHGLLGWCFRGTGQNVSPFNELRNNHQPVWAECIEAVR